MRLFFISLLLTASTAIAQQIPDTDFQYSIAKPYFEIGKGPVIAIDEAHYNFHTLEGRFAAFGNLLNNDGYVLKKFDDKLNINTLNKVHILVISNALNKRNARDWTLPTPSAFKQDEITALNEWVKEGGKLLLIADHMPMAGAVADLAASFNILFENAFALDQRKRTTEYFTKADSTLRNTSVTQDGSSYMAVDSIVNFTGSAFKATGNVTPVMVLDEPYQLVYPDTAWKFHSFTKTIPAKGYCQLALVKYGKGKIIVSAEAAMFSAQLAGSQKIPMGFNNPAAKYNCQFILNLFHWLEE